MEELLCSKKKIHYNCEEDSLLWYAAKSRMYKVQLGYKLERHREKDIEWPEALSGHKSVLPKAGAFLWIVLHEGILIGERLKLIGISGPSVCTLCKEDGETVEHLPFWCPYAKRCWDWLLDCLQCHLVRNQSLKDFLCSWPNSAKSSKWGILWVVSPSMLTWHLWKERNRRIFNDKALEVDVHIPKIKHAIEEVVNVKTLGRTYKTYTKCDMAKENIWILSKNSDYKFSDSKSCRKSIKWTPPLSGF